MVSTIAVLVGTLTSKMAATANGEEGAEVVFQPPKDIQEKAHVSSFDQYRKMHKESVEDPDKFWGAIAQQFTWKNQPKGKRFEYNFEASAGPISIRFNEGVKTNLCYNVLDRVVKDLGRGDKIAFYWEGSDPADSSQVTYKELLARVCQFANVLKANGVKRGDRVAIYMPMILELVVAMLACARIGAIHSIVFGGFSADSLAERIMDAKCRLLVTADGTWRGTKLVNLKEIVDDALAKCKAQGYVLKMCIVVRHLGRVASGEPGADGKVQQSNKRTCHDVKTPWNEGVDCWWDDAVKDKAETCEPEWVDSEDALFMLYTSGSTGKPKGVVHTTGGYMVYAATTFKYVFDYQPDDVYWCTADIGWITGHTYVVYGPMLNGATSVIFEGIPFHPDAGRYWQIVDRYSVSKFYTAPTAIRALMKYGDHFVTQYKRTSLRILGSVGEPINPEAWLWYHRVVGNSSCAIVDTFWQTETGGHVLTPLPGATPTKPGSATFPFFGVVPAILSEEGKELEGEAEGYLVFKQPWPGIMRTVYGDQERFETTYFKKFNGFYCTGDGARRDKDGYFWVTGRVDDMLNVSGHLLSTAQVESALIEHPSVAETAVVSHPHPVKGECLYCFITLKDGKQFTDELVHELKTKVRVKIGPFATPEYLQSAPGLPKTRSGKIMRRVLRKIASNDRDLGDTTTLADESVVEQLFQLRPKELRV